MNEKKVKINRKYKDRLFLMVFKDKVLLLELYNALNGTNYANAEELEITTLEDAVYMAMKNDISFIFNHELELYEHQSTYSDNMPLRGLLYLTDVFQGYVERQKKISFPAKGLCCQDLSILYFIMVPRKNRRGRSFGFPILLKERRKSRLVWNLRQ